MSYCEIIPFVDGKPVEAVAHCRNAWKGAALIWDNLYKNYIDPTGNWLFPPENTNKLFALNKDVRLFSFMKAVLISTFDYAIIDRGNFARYIKDLKSFSEAFNIAEQSHINTWIDAISTLSPEVEAIGFYQTSVAENLWYPRNEQTEDSEPYDLNKDDKHFEVYEALDEDKFSIFEKVKYKTNSFGILRDDKIIEVYLLCECKDTNTGLLYSPKDEDGCGCFMIAKKNKEDIYENVNEKSFVNCNPINKDFLHFLNGATK